MRGRILLLTTVVVLGVGLSVSLIQASSNLRASYDEMYDANRLAHLSVTLDQPRPQSHDPVLAFAARGFQDLDEGIARLTLDGVVDVEDDEKKATLVGMPPHRWPLVNDICILDGPLGGLDYACTPAEKRARGIAPIGTEDGIYLHTTFGIVHEIRQGQQLDVTIGGETYAFRVLGFAINSEFLLASSNPDLFIFEEGSLGLMWASDERLQQIARALGHEAAAGERLVTEYAFRMTGGDEEDKARAALAHYQGDERRFADLNIRALEVREDTFWFQAAEGDIEGFRQMTPLIAGIVILVALGTVAVTMERLVTGQRPIIGVLRALGMARSELVAHYLSFGLVIGTIGAIFGIPLGWWGSRALTVWYRTFIEFPSLHIGFDILTIGTLASAAIVACVVGGLRASLRAARMPISSAMRPVSPGHPSATWRRLTQKVGLVTRMALRNIARSKRRSAATVLGLAFSIVITFSMLGVMSSSVAAIERSFAREEWDGVISIRPPQQVADLEASLLAVSWVTKAEPYLTLPALVDGMDDPVALVGLVDDSLHRLEVIDGSESFRGANSLIVTPAFLRGYQDETSEDIGVGDPITIVFDGTRYRFTVDAIAEEIIGTTLYVPRATLQDLAGAPIANAVYVDVASGRQPDKDDLASVPGYVDYTPRSILETTLDDSFATLVGFSLVFVLIGAILGLVVVLNTAAVNLQERTPEHGTLKAMGFDDSTLILILSIEHLFIGIIAAVLGASLGVAGTIALIDLFTQGGLVDLPYATSWPTIIAIASGVVVLAQSSTLAARRHLRRLDIPAIVKERGL